MKKKASVSEKPDAEPGKSDDACVPPSVDGRSANELLSLTKHPLFGKTLVLPTEPIKEMVGAMRRAVILRELGCCFTATSGYGKSRGLIMAEHELRKIFPNVPIFRHIVDNQQVPSIRAFFKNFLLTVGITDIAGETFDLRVRLGSALEEAGLGGSEKMVVLLIDEAQGMALQDFCFLKDIGNQLERVDVHFVVFMMGQEPEFTRMAQRLREAGRLDLVSRFTLRQVQFKSLKEESDFTNLFSIMDTACYPTNGDCPWTKYFAPNAWESGLRMETQVKPMLHSLNDLVPGGVSRNGVSARQLFLAIRRFLIAIAELDIGRKALPADLWRECNQYALIAEAAAIASSEKKGRRLKVNL